jgi:hypothetical protein
MGLDHPLRNNQGRLGEPSLRADEPTDDALSLLGENALRGDEPALWGDEHTADVHSLLEENARLRGLLVQLSDLIRRNVVSIEDYRTPNTPSDEQSLSLAKGDQG